MIPKISVITINRNNLSGLKKTLSSLRDQIYKDFELLVIDGASTDGSLSFINSNLDIINRYISEKDTGIYNAQNKGISLAKGEYLFFLNSGDCLLNERVLSDISDFFINEPDVIYGDILIEINENEIIERRYPDRLTLFYWSINSLCHQAVFIHKNVFDVFGKYDEEYLLSADFDFFQRVWHGGKLSIEHVPVFVTLYDLNGVSSQERNRNLVSLEYKRIKKRHFPTWAYLLFLVINFILTHCNEFPFIFLKKIYSRFYSSKSRKAN